MNSIKRDLGSLVIFRRLISSPVISALIKLDEGGFDETVKNAMIACTARADELGKNK